MPAIFKPFLRVGASGGVGLPSSPTGAAAQQPAKFAGAPKPPSNLTPPTQKPPRGGGGLQVRTQGQARQSTTMGGLPTGRAQQRQGFNPFQMPKSMAQFNQEVNQATAPTYQPQLQQNNADVAAENAANQQRTGDISSIYSQYGAQAQQAFDETKNALQQIIQQENAGNGQAANYLQSALGSALGSSDQLGQMMGMSPQSPQAQAAETAPYLATAANANAGGEQYMGALAAGETAGQGQNLANVGIERTSQLNTESQRHGAELQTLSANRDAIVQQIPSLVEQTREKLLTDLLNAQGINFQERLAQSQFGLSKQAQNANIRNAQATLGMNQANAAANRRNAASQTALNRQQLKINAQAVKEKAAADRVKLQQTLAKAQGQQQANAIKFLQGWITPSKTAIVPGHYVTDPTTGNRTYVAPHIEPNYHLDPGYALKEMMDAYGLDLRSALSLMSGLASPIGGQWGTMTVGQWASTYLQRAAQRTANGVLRTGNQLVPAAPGLVGGTLKPKPSWAR